MIGWPSQAVCLVTVFGLMALWDWSRVTHTSTDSTWSWRFSGTPQGCPLICHDRNTDPPETSLEGAASCFSSLRNKKETGKSIKSGKKEVDDAIGAWWQKVVNWGTELGNRTVIVFPLLLVHRDSKSH